MTDQPDNESQKPILTTTPPHGRPLMWAIVDATGIAHETLRITDTADTATVTLLLSNAATIKIHGDTLIATYRIEPAVWEKNKPDDPPNH